MTHTIRHWCLVMTLCVISSAVLADEQPLRWQHFAPIEQPERDVESPWIDFVLGRDIFGHARYDLGDLRVYDSNDETVPYALRVLKSEFRRQAFKVEAFNRAEGGGGVAELTMDLKRDNLEHNQVEINTPGNNFRRKVELEGSTDGKTWASLTTTYLIQFKRGKDQIKGNAISYPPSRFRYLRIRVFPDPQQDKGAVQIGEVAVVRKVEILGETLTLDGSLGDREPVRANRAPGSAWIIDLGGDQVPCDSIEVEIDDDEFVRDYYIEAAGPAGSLERFYRVSLSSDHVWRRRPGQPKTPMKASFQEVRASRLRLVVVDHRNPPLKLKAVKFSAPVRQIVLARPAEEGTDLRLFFGNPEGQAPVYDFARNLPDRLEPSPLRGRIGGVTTNPTFVPPPKPLTDRWPWLIYVVLGFISVVLTVLMFNVARAAIAAHDGTKAEPDLSAGGG